MSKRSKRKRKRKNKLKRLFGRRKKQMLLTEKEINEKFNTVAPAGEEYWETEIDCVEACSKAPADVVIWMKPLVKVKIDALMEKYPNIEWLAYLVGNNENENKNIVEDIYIPKQQVTATKVDNIEATDFNKLPIIGVLHSHHGMGNGFSGTDHEYVNGNHDISLVISKDGVAGQVRWKTPCGAFKIVAAKVRPLMEVDFNKEEFLKTETEKIETKTYTSPYGNTPYTYQGDGGEQGRFVQKGPETGTGGRVFPNLNKQEQELVNELDNMEDEEETWSVEEETDEQNELEDGDQDQSLNDALKEAFGE